MISEYVVSHTEIVILQNRYSGITTSIFIYSETVVVVVVLLFFVHGKHQGHGGTVS